MLIKKRQILTLNLISNYHVIREAMSPMQQEIGNKLFETRFKLIRNHLLLTSTKFLDEQLNID